jgi:bifunctional non-homologous end joining protein LigD
MDAIAKRGDTWVSNRAKEDAREKPKSKPKKPTQKAHKLPAFIEPQLATRVDKPPGGEGWLHEIKFDGYRLHIRIQNGKVKILTRHGEDWTHKFATLAHAMARLPVESCYIDGEAVILDEGGISDFSALQAWFKAARKRDLVFFAFDMLHLNGADLRSLPLTERKTLLQTLIADTETPEILRYSDHQRGHGPAFFEASASLKVEGIVSKVADAPYTSGRNRAWLKIKRIERQEFVIGGYTMTSTGHDAIGALLLGEYQNGKLIYVGKVGTGFSAADAKSLFKNLSRDGRKTSPFDKVPAEVRRTAHWTEPTRIAEIEFGAWTSEHILRHSAFLGLREDKEPKEVKTERVLPVKDAAVRRPSQKKGATRAVRARKSAVEVLGIPITHPDRLIYPKEKITKQEVAAYYASVAGVMLPHVSDRPLSLVRCPDGVGPACFFQKHAGAGLPEDIHQHHIGKGNADEVLTVDSARGLVSLVQRGVLEVHVWGSHLAQVEQPDLVVIDFDPDEGMGWKKVVKAGQDMRDMLEDIGLKSFVKTTGGKGLHIVIPVKPALEWDGIKEFSKTVAARFAAQDPDLFLITMSKKARAGRIFIDYLRNGRGATAVAPYSTRARPGATVATPVSWKELKDGALPQDFTIKTVQARIGRGFKDPWKGINSVKQNITVNMIEKLTKA